MSDANVSIMFIMASMHSRPNRHKRPNRHTKSTITKAHPTSPSVRTTIPHQITEDMGWDAGDVLSWIIEKRGEKYFAIVRRLE